MPQAQSSVLQLHMPLAFSDDEHAINDNDIVLQLQAFEPSLGFLQTAALRSDADGSGIALVKARGRPEIHVLGGRLKINSTIDVQAACETGAHLAIGTGPLKRFDLEATSGSAATHVAQLKSDGVGDLVLQFEDLPPQVPPDRVTMRIDARGRHMRVEGGALVQDGVDLLRLCRLRA